MKNFIFRSGVKQKKKKKRIIAIIRFFLSQLKESPIPLIELRRDAERNVPIWSYTWDR